MFQTQKIMYIYPLFLHNKDDIMDNESNNLKKDSQNFFQKLWKSFRSLIALSEYTDIAAATDNIQKNIQFKGPTVYILAFAIVIASVGLNVNSIPVIIGAMLISPLMGPIIGIGYGLGINDTDFLKKAFKNWLIMVVISLLVSTIYFLLSPLQLENPTELLARTNPTIFDVLIALFGGFAGIVELSKKEKGTVISGVAIATALMPPLCTAGYGLAMGEFRYLLGALYLFFINSVFIALSTFVVVKFLRFPSTHFADPAKEKRVRTYISLFTVILIIPSVISAIMVVKENNFNQTARRFVNTNKTLAKSYIYDYKTDHHSKPPVVEISIAGEALTEGETEMLFRSAEGMGIARNQLLIKQNAANIQDNSLDKAVVQGIFERNDIEIERREATIAKMESELKKYKDLELPYEQMAKELASQYPQITSFSLARGTQINPSTLESEDQIIVIISTDPKLTDNEMTLFKRWLNVRLNFKNLKVIEE